MTSVESHEVGQVVVVNVVYSRARVDHSKEEIKFRGNRRDRRALDVRISITEVDETPRRDRGDERQKFAFCYDIVCGRARLSECDTYLGGSLAR